MSYYVLFLILYSGCLRNCPSCCPQVLEPSKHIECVCLAPLSYTCLPWTPCLTTIKKFHCLIARLPITLPPKPRVDLSLSLRTALSFETFYLFHEDLVAWWTGFIQNLAISTTIENHTHLLLLFFWDFPSWGPKVPQVSLCSWHSKLFRTQHTATNAPKPWLLSLFPLILCAHIPTVHCRFDAVFLI